MFWLIPFSSASPTCFSQMEPQLLLLTTDVLWCNHLLKSGLDNAPIISWAQGSTSYSVSESANWIATRPNLDQKTTAFPFQAVRHGSFGSEKLNSFSLLSLSDALQNIMGGSKVFLSTREKEREVDPDAYGSISSPYRIFAV